MVKSSLIQSLCKLNKKEVERFFLFVKSPYYNSNKNVIKLIEYLLLHFGNFNYENCSKEMIHRNVYSNNKFDYVQLRRLFSSTLKLLEEMLIIEYRNENEMETYLNLLNVLIQKNMNKRVEKTIQKIENILATPTNSKKSDEYYLKYKIIDTLDGWYVSQLDYTKPHFLQQKTDALDKHYLLEKLFQTCGMLNRQNTLAGTSKPIEYDYSLVETLDQYISNNDYFKDEIALNIYHKLYKSLVDENDEKNYFELCELVENNIELFDRANGADIYVNLMNFAARRINEGKKHFLSHIFEIQKSMLKNGFLMDDGIITDLSFQNLVTTSLGLKEFKWAKNFIDEYHTYLPENIKKNAYNYNLAVYYCEINNYEKAHNLLSNIEYNNLIYSLNARAMLLRIYFETNEANALEAHANAFKVYLMRNKMINKEKYRKFYNLFRFTQSLFKIKQDLPYEKKSMLKDKFDKLLKKIDTSGKFPSKRWLYEQTRVVKDAIT